MLQDWSVELFTGTTLASLQRIQPSSGPAVIDGRNFYSWAVDSSQAYYVRVALPTERPTRAGSVSMLEADAWPVPNDDFATRLPLKGSRFDISGTTAGIGFGSLWWTWTAPRAGVLRVWNTPKTVQQTFRGTDPANLTNISTGSAVIPVSAGDEIHIAARGDHPGPFEWHLEFADPAPNIEPGTALQVAADGSRIIADFTRTDAVPNQDGSLENDWLWWKWTAPVGGQALIFSDNSAHFWFTDGGQNSANVVAGRTYYIIGAGNKLSEFRIEFEPTAITMELQRRTDSFQLHFTGPSETVFILESSDDLIDWSPVLHLPSLRALGHLKPLRESSAVANADPKRPLKVAWITYFPIEWLPDLPPELQSLPRLHPGTWQRVLWEEFRADESLDLHIMALRNHFPKSMRFRIGSTTFHCVKTPRGFRAPSLFWTDTFLTSRVLNEIRPDLVHAWGTEFGGAAVASRLRYPALVTMQGILTWLDSVSPLNRTLKISRMVEPASLKKAHVVTCESSFAMRYLHDRYPHLKLLQIEHAPSPMFSQVLRQPQLNPVRILCIGHVSIGKGADVVVNALARLVQEFEFEVVWVGAQNHTLEQELRRKTGGEIWGRITFKENLPSEEIAQELARATFLLHAARADNSPNAVKEAVIAGVPVVATRTGGVPDYVFPGRNGFLFESGNADDCGARIRDALTHPQFKQGRVDSETLLNVREYLSVKTMARKFRDAYAETLRSDPRALTTNSQ